MANKKYHYVYKTINMINEKFYYGVHSTNKIDDKYIGSGKILKTAIKKYGRKSFKKEIIQMFESREEAFNFEADIIKMEMISDDRCYNLKSGGSGHSNYRPMTDELKQYFSELNRKYKHTPEAIEKIREAGLGRKMSEQCMIKRKEYWKNNPDKLKERGIKVANTRRKNGSYGHSEETRKLISQREFEYVSSGGVKARHYECEIDGVFYKTIKHICEAFKINRRECNKRLLSNEYPNWKIINNQKLKPLLKKADKRFNKCIIENIEYQNIYEASIKLNIEANIIKMRLKSTDFPDWIHIKPENARRATNGKQCSIDGEIFESATSAGIIYEIPGSTVLSRIKSKKLKWESWKFLE
jgi:hypothetical protein